MLLTAPVFYGPRGGAYLFAQETYGQKKPVRNIREARRALLDYTHGKGLRIGQIKEKKLFFEAVITDKNGNMVDKVIIDKRTGRIRSIF